MLRWLVGCVLALASLAAPTAALAGKRVALVIGNNDYANLGRLNNAVPDAERIGMLLANGGFEVVSCPGQSHGCYNVNRAGLLDAFDSLRQAVKDAELVVVFYSGHGMEGDQGNVLAPVDMQVDCEKGEKQARRQVPLKDLLDALAKVPQKIVILDACRNDPLPKCPPARGMVPVSFASFAIPPGGRIMVVSSTKPGQVAFDGVPGQHSPFSRVLIQWLEQSPALYFNQLFDQVAKKVIEDTSRTQLTQVPEVLSSGGAPADCLAGQACEADPQITALRAELKLLQEGHARDQDYKQIAEAFLKGIGIRGDRPLSDEEREKVLTGVKRAVGDLVSRGDATGDDAVKRLRVGDDSQARKIFADQLATTQEKAKTAQGPQQTQLLAEAARAARNLGNMERPRSVAKAAEYFKKAVEIDGDDAQTWYDLGETLRDGGKAADARDAFDRAAGLAKAQGRLSLAVRSLYRKGDMVRRLTGERSAQEIFQVALTTAKQGAELHPDDPDLQHGIAETYVRIGDTQWNDGKLADALDSYRTALAVAEPLTRSNPNNGLWQRTLSGAYVRIGDIQFDQTDFAASLVTYRKGLEVIARLAKAEPSNGLWQREHSLSLNRVADTLKEMKDLPGALRSYREALAIRTRLSKGNPTHLDWLFDLGLSHIFVGSTLLSQKQLRAARAELEESRDIMARLVAKDPKQLRWQRELTLAQVTLGDVLLEQRNPSAALYQYRGALKTREKLAQIEPGNLQRKYDIAIGHWRVARALARQDARAQAAAEFRTSRDLLKYCIDNAQKFTRWSDTLAELDREMAASSK